jgi:hypothetical protein
MNTLKDEFREINDCTFYESILLELSKTGAGTGYDVMYYFT